MISIQIFIKTKQPNPGLLELMFWWETAMLDAEK